MRLRSNPPSDPETSARMPLLHELNWGHGPQAFLQYLRMSTSGAGVRARYRLVDFTDECPISSDAEINTEQGTASSEDEIMEEPHLQLSDSFPVNLPGPSNCSYLSSGQSFIGSQRVPDAPARAADDWQVVVRIQGLDMSNGYVCGVMEAQNVPQARTPIITFWEGEIVDNNNYTFFTQKWVAQREDDLQHWSKFPAFAALEHDVKRQGGRSQQLATSPCIFMRWKEVYFVNTSESCGLTIAGFYYICIDRQSGAITGYYFDPKSQPFQFLSLKPLTCAGGGMAFGSYQLQ